MLCVSATCDKNKFAAVGFPNEAISSPIGNPPPKLLLIIGMCCMLHKNFRAALLDGFLLRTHATTPGWLLAFGTSCLLPPVQPLWAC